MQKTRILTDDDPLESLLQGAEKLYKAVSTTMGPRGNNVIFRRQGMKTGVTHDGVTVARAVRLDDPAQDVGADLLREAASKLDSVTGDGTTTVTVLAYHILNEAAKKIEDGYSPMKLRLEVEEDSKYVIKEIEKLINKKPTKEDIIAVASIAAGNKDIGKEIGEAIYKAGKDTPVILDFSEGDITTIDTINGFKLGNGPASSYLLEGSGLRLEIPNPMVIVCDANLQTKEDIIPILKTISNIPPENRKFLLVCTDVGSEALQLLVVNRLKGFAECAVAKVPKQIANPSLFLQDVAIATGAKVLSRNTGHAIFEPADEDFGSAQKVIVELDDTIIVNGKADPMEFADHVEALKNSKKTPSIAKLSRDRLTTLEQKVISIRVGGQSETDAEEKHYRYEDAIGASRAALRHGVVPGGGTVLFSIGQVIGDTVLGKALQAPMQIVLGNAGIEVPVKVTAGFGIDVMHPEKGSIKLAEAGILDPAQSEIESVKTAVSIAGLLMTSGAMIVDERSEDEAATLPRVG